MRFSVVSENHRIVGLFSGKSWRAREPGTPLPLFHSESQAGPAVELGLAIY
jgi:hypothetical protein